MIDTVLLADSILPHINASLNGLATLLLVIGWLMIRAGRETGHKTCMLSCFVVSIIFLGCYLVYHYQVGQTEFDRDRWPRAAIVYYVLLATHVPLAMTIPVLAATTIYFGLTDQRSRHRKIARWTFPIWLYVSVTGVGVYLMIYWWFPPGP